MAIYWCQTATQVSLFVGFLILWANLATKTTKIGTPRIKVISQCIYIYIYTNFLVVYIYIYIFIYFSIHKTVYNFVCGNMALWWSDVTIFENEEYRLLSFEIQCQPQINLIKLSIGGRQLGISRMFVISSPFFGEMRKMSLNLIWFIHCVYYDIFLNTRIVNSKIKLRNKSWNFIPSQKQG